MLHHPAYRASYEINLKREFPRLPFYGDFRQWAKWGGALMELHFDPGQAAPFALQRHDRKEAVCQQPDLLRDERVKPKRGLDLGDDKPALKPKLTADKAPAPSGWMQSPRWAASRPRRGLPARQPQRPRMGARPMEGTQKQRPDGGDSVQPLPLRRPQGAGDRPAPARLHRERGDDEDRARDAGAGDCLVRQRCSGESAKGPGELSKIQDAMRKALG